MGLSVEARQNIKTTYDRLGNVAKTAKECNVSCHAAKRWISAGTVIFKPSTGRKKLLSKAAAARALDVLHTEEAINAKHAAQLLKHEGLTQHLVSRPTLIRAAREAAKAAGCKLKATRGKPPKELTQATKQKRLQFAAANTRRTWSNVMFSDRKKFAFRYPGSKVRPLRWQKVGPNVPKREGVWQPSHAQVLNVYGGITPYGVTKLHEVSGSSKIKSTYLTKKGKPSSNICQAEYKAVLHKTLLPEGKRLYGIKGVSSWVLQQDGDKAHNQARREVAEYNEGKGCSIQLLRDWPRNSPDLSPIENVWGYVQQKVDALGCSSYEQFRAAVHEQFAAVPAAYLRTLYNSIPKRLQLVVEMEGDRTGY